MLNPNSQMLLMIALGDAYGAGVEFIERSPDIMDIQISKALNFNHYLQHPHYKTIKPGNYTDDTEMSVANARVLIDNNYPFNKLQFADAYLKEFIRGGMRRGYSGKLYQFLSSINSGQELIDNISSNSEKNGAAMRSIPFGVMNDIFEMLDATTVQASLTHNTSTGLFSARIVALMSHYVLYTNDDFSKMSDFLISYTFKDELEKYGHIFSKPWDGGLVEDRPNCPISINTVHAVIDLLKNSSSLIDIMRKLILWKGDTDSVAALAWGIYSGRYRKDKLPEFLYNDLEQGNEKTGVKYLIDIGNRLINKYN